MPQSPRPSLPCDAGFWIIAEGFRDSGDATFEKIRSDSYVGQAVIPCLFLYFRSIELALKACIVAHQISENEIVGRRLGHQLSLLMNRMEQFAALETLGISPSNRVMLDRFSSDYANKWFEYPDSAWCDHPRLEDLKTLSHAVVEATRTYSPVLPNTAQISP